MRNKAVYVSSLVHIGIVYNHSLIALLYRIPVQKRAGCKGNDRVSVKSKAPRVDCETTALFVATYGDYSLQGCIQKNNVQTTNGSLSRKTMPLGC